MFTSEPGIGPISERMDAYRTWIDDFWHWHIVLDTPARGRSISSDDGLKVDAGLRSMEENHSRFALP